MNVALNKPASQSSTYSASYPASKAVNGITDGSSDFSHTNASNRVKWWKVDLQAKYTIGRIKLYNRPNFRKYIRPA